MMVSTSVSVELVPGPLTKARDLLRNKGIEFMITGAPYSIAFSTIYPSVSFT